MGERVAADGVIGVGVSASAGGRGREVVEVEVGGDEGHQDPMRVSMLSGPSYVLYLALEDINT